MALASLAKSAGTARDSQCRAARRSHVSEAGLSWWCFRAPYAGPYYKCIVCDMFFVAHSSWLCVGRDGKYLPKQLLRLLLVLRKW